MAWRPCLARASITAEGGEGTTQATWDKFSIGKVEENSCLYCGRRFVQESVARYMWAENTRSIHLIKTAPGESRQSDPLKLTSLRSVVGFTGVGGPVWAPRSGLQSERVTEELIAVQRDLCKIQKKRIAWWSWQCKGSAARSPRE